MIAVNSPNQSQELGEENIPPPPEIMVADISNQAVIASRKREAISYEREVKKRALEKPSHVTTSDVDNATSYRI